MPCPSARPDFSCPKMSDAQYQRPPWRPGDGILAGILASAFIYCAGWQFGGHAWAGLPPWQAFRIGMQFLGAFHHYSDWPWRGLIIGVPSLGAAIIGGGLAGYFSARPNNPSGVRHVAGPRLIERSPKTNGDGIEPLRGWKWDLRDEVAHTLVLGSSGGGKTTVIRKFVREYHARGDKLLISDPKGDFVSELPGLIIFAPWDQRSHRWKIGEDLRNELVAKEWAEMTIPTPKQGDPVWSKAAQSLLIAALHKIRAELGTSWYLHDLREYMIAQFKDPDLIQRTVHEFLPEASGVVQEVHGKTFASIMLNYSAEMRDLLLLCKLDSELRDAIRPGMSLTAWAKAGKAPPLVLLHHQQAPGMTKGFCAGVIDYLVSHYSNLPDCAAGERRVAFILDEVPQLGRVPSIIRGLEILRSKGVRIALGAQSPAQFSSIYDRDMWQIVQDTTATKIVTRIVGVDSAEWAQRLVGTRVVERYQWSRSGGQITEQWVRSDEPIIGASRFKADLAPNKRGVGLVVIPAGGGNVYLCRAPFDQVQRRREPHVFWPDAQAGAVRQQRTSPTPQAQPQAAPSRVADPVGLTAWLVGLQGQEQEPGGCSPAGAEAPRRRFKLREPQAEAEGAEAEAEED